MLDRIGQQLEVMKGGSDESIEWTRFITEELAGVQDQRYKLEPELHNGDRHFHDELQSGVGLFTQKCNRMLKTIDGKKRRTRVSEEGSHYRNQGGRKWS